MKIAIISSALAGKGGMETVFKKLYFLAKEDEELKITFVFTDGVKDKEYLKNFNDENVIYHEHTNRIEEAFFLFNSIRKNKFDYLIATSKKTLILTSYIKHLLRLKVPIVSWIHFSISKNGMYVDLSKYGDAHFAISKKIYSQIINMGVDKNKVFYLPNFINKTEDTIGLAENKYIYIGRVEFKGQKNLKELIDGLAKYKRNWSIDIYGTGKSIDLCQKYIYKNYPNLVQKFNWKGWVSNPWGCIDKATALLLTSTMEGMPMVLLESISKGLPVLSSNCPTGPSDIIQPGINGYLYKMENLDDFVCKINEISKNKMDREKIKKSIDRFSESNYLRNLKESLKKINIIAR